MFVSSPALGPFLWGDADPLLGRFGLFLLWRRRDVYGVLESMAFTEVRPRVGGGTPNLNPVAAWVLGLSPRGRGNLVWGVRLRLCPRSIPAWAGEPTMRRSGRQQQGVYPRVGGGTFTGSPSWHWPPGLSPRGRGNRYPGDGHSLDSGSIPAWAGEPLSSKQSAAP